MARRLFASKFLLSCILLTALGCFLLAIYPLQEGACKCNQEDDKEGKAQGKPGGGTSGKSVGMTNGDTGNIANVGSHRLAVIVPLRDRFEELMEFVPHMHKFLTQQNISHKIFIINQVDNFRFNRAALINTGFLESRSTCDYIAMHDVDLLPVNPDLSYEFPESGPHHVASPQLHPLYHYKTFVGGILLIRGDHFEKLNGLSNKYWGWGREDDEFWVRMRKSGLTVSRPQNITTGNQTFKHVHDRRKRPRDNKRYFDQREKTRRLDRETGASTVQYKIDSRREMTIDDAPFTVINVLLHCDLALTPWCLRPEDHDWYLKQKKPT